MEEVIFRFVLLSIEVDKPSHTYPEDTSIGIGFFCMQLRVRVIGSRIPQRLLVSSFYMPLFRLKREK